MTSRSDTRTGSIQFTYRDASGVSVVKTIDIQPDGQPFLLRVNTEVLVNGQRQRVTIHGGAGFGDIERGVQSTSWLVPATYQPPQAILQKVETSDAIRIPAVNIATQPVQEGLTRYAGVDDQYFLAAALAGGKNARVDLHAADGQDRRKATARSSTTGSASPAMRR